MNRKLLAPYGLKFNPFAPDIPLEALYTTPLIDNFCKRLEWLAREGGFAQILGAPGSGKSAALRLVLGKMSNVPEIVVGVLTRPQCGVADLYRELGDLYGLQLRPNNRWASSKVLRARWQEHIQQSLFRPVLFVDEAQEMQAGTLNELRLLTSKDLDSCSLLSVVLAGDLRLIEKLNHSDLLPVNSRTRVRLKLDELNRDQLMACLRHCVQSAGNARLMTPELMAALCDHAAGNLRALMVMADEMLQIGLERGGCPLDEKLFLESYPVPAPRRASSGRPAR
jgi:type II secretory pathway predicted ATPase ExeA